MARAAEGQWGVRSFKAVLGRRQIRQCMHGIGGGGAAEGGNDGCSAGRLFGSKFGGVKTITKKRSEGEGEMREDSRAEW